MKKNTFAYIRLLIFVAVAVTMDQLTKALATAHLSNNRDVILIKDILELHYLDGGNTGAAWGIFSGKTMMFIAFTILAICVIAKFIYNIQQHLSKNYGLIFLQYLFALLGAGAIGNLIDRMSHRYVIDFIYLKWINFPIFNVADCYVTVSCFLIVIICLFKIQESEFNEIFSLKFKKVVQK